jgi:cell division protein FtsB
LTQLEPHKEQLPLRLRLEIELARQFLGTSLRGLVRGLPSYEAVVQKREQLHTQMQQLHAGDAPANELANGLEVLDE